jgi:adenylate cyclase
VAEERAQRRLAAILAADVVGYSRLMGADESGTLKALNAHRNEFIHPTVTQYRGRIVKLMGDGALVEFASVVDAVECAVAVQRGMAERNADVPEDRRIAFRIGINLGDIIIDGDDIYGDGVNVAARLEAEAEPGGVCISDDAHRQVAGKLDLAFEDLGARTLKNIAGPVRAHRWPSGKTADVSSGAGASADGHPPLPDKPSIAVMPFDDLSAEKDQEYFADGIVEDVITGLSRFKWLFVIARASTVTYRGRAIDPALAGRELGVRYILEGSVRKAGNRVRITTVLIDARNGTQVWAEKYDGALDDIFDLQDEITTSVIGAVEPNLRQAEIGRARLARPDSLDAYDLYLRALPLAYANTPDDGREALGLLEQALGKDPTFASAHGVAAWCHEQLFNRSEGAEEHKSAALRHAAAAIAHGSDDPTALCMAGFSIALVSKDYDAALKAIDRSLVLNPSSASAYAFSSALRAFSCDYDTAIEHGQRSIRLSPLDPMGGQPYVSLACTYLPLGRYEEAAEAAAMAIQLNPSFSYPQGLYVIALVKLGRMDAACEAAA